jgi:hypothetical protein
LPKTLLSTFAVRLAALGIAEPSALLAEAIGFIGQAVRAATPPGGAPTFDASLIPARVNPPGEQDLAGWLAKCCDRRSSKASNAACGQANEAPATARERASIE